jgi:hypothetical protein
MNMSEEKKIPFYEKIKFEGGTEERDCGEDGGYTIVNEKLMFINCPASQTRNSPFTCEKGCKFFGGYDMENEEFENYVLCSFKYKEKHGGL